MGGHLMVTNAVSIFYMLVPYRFCFCLYSPSFTCWERDKCSVEFQWPWLNLPFTWMPLLRNVFSCIGRISLQIIATCIHQFQWSLLVQILVSRQCTEKFQRKLIFSHCFPVISLCSLFSYILWISGSLYLLFWLSSSLLLPFNHEWS